MATEITCIVPDRADHRRIEALGGPGWLQDTETVIGQIEEGRRYYVRLGSAQVNVVLSRRAPLPAAHRPRRDPRERTPHPSHLPPQPWLIPVTHKAMASITLSLNAAKTNAAKNRVNSLLRLSILRMWCG